jgi:hypothetical protein
MEGRMSDDIELNCDEYHVKSASIGQGPSGTVFRCTLGPMSDEVFETLAGAARSEATLRLIFPKQPLVLERIDVKRIEPGSVQIVGRVVTK